MNEADSRPPVNSFLNKFFGQVWAADAASASGPKSSPLAAPAMGSYSIQRNRLSIFAPESSYRAGIGFVLRAAEMTCEHGDQPQNRQGARPHHPGNAARDRRRGD